MLEWKPPCSGVVGSLGAMAVQENPNVGGAHGDRLKALAIGFIQDPSRGGKAEKIKNEKLKIKGKWKWIVTIHTQGFQPCMWDEERGPLTRAIDG